MKFTLLVDVESADGAEDTFELTVDGRDVRAWEAATGQNFLGRAMSMTVASQLAYHAAVRTGRFTGTPAEWDAVNTGTRDVRSDREVEADTRPTRRGRGGARQSG